MARFVLPDGLLRDRLSPGGRPPARRDVCRGLAGAGLAGCGMAAGSARADSWASGANALHIVVVKSERRLMLVRAGTAFLTFPVALGSHPRGPKRAAGDGRTPEGRYAIDGFNEQSRYYRALHISYPNPDDMRRALAAGVSPGGDIEIHGMPPELAHYDPSSFPSDWTDGCIAVSNRAIDAIWRNVGLDTPVVITA